MIRTGVLLLSTLAVISEATIERSLPVVDLGYELHRAISYNVSWPFKFRKSSN
jgi:hypothetical protein